MKEVIKFFNSDKGFGFIRSDETEEDVYIHYSIVKDDLQEGDTVEFEVENTHKGLKATSMTKL